MQGGRTSPSRAHSGTASPAARASGGDGGASEAADKPHREYPKDWTEFCGWYQVRLVVGLRHPCTKKWRFLERAAHQGRAHQCKRLPTRRSRFFYNNSGTSCCRPRVGAQRQCKLPCYGVLHVNNTAPCSLRHPTAHYNRQGLAERIAPLLAPVPSFTVKHLPPTQTSIKRCCRCCYCRAWWSEWRRCWRRRRAVTTQQRRWQWTSPGRSWSMFTR